MMAKRRTNPVDRYVGARIRSRRLVLGLSQQNVGDELGLSFQQVQKYEKGTNRVGASRLLQIASILQMPAASFFEGAPTGPGEKRVAVMPPLPDYVPKLLASADGLALVRAFVRITDRRLRRAIVTLVKQLERDET